MFKKVTLITLALLTSAAGAIAGDYSSIAFSESSGKWGGAWGKDDARSAEKEAIAACDSEGCHQVAWTKDAYAALASGDGGYYGWAWNADRDVALQEAISRCEELTFHCVWRQWVHSDPTGKSEGRSNIAPPGQVKLKEIGGSFKYRIPGFVGFKQEQENWCWAASTETIFFAMTHTRLQQSELARLQMKNSDGQPARDLMKQLTQIDPKSCQGDEGSSPRCDHIGNPGTALGVLGKSFPFERYPEKTESVATYSSIRKSLEKNVPVAIRVVWSDGFAHIVVVFGASYFAEPTDKSANPVARVKLELFDPYDGKTYRMSSNQYLPDYQYVPGSWDMRVYLGNYEDPKMAELPKESDPFLAPKQR